MRKGFLALLMILYICTQIKVNAQTDTSDAFKEYLDSLYIIEIQDKAEPEKVLHAEPLYIDLIRDLGARKGEKEWNVGLGMTDNNGFDSYTALVEYEFAPVDRLGLEIEFPFTFYKLHVETDTANFDYRNRRSRLDGIKLAAQWSFYVSEKNKTTLALGYINETLVPAFRNLQSESFIQGNVYNPFFIAAKRWGKNFHTLLYTGPIVDHHFHGNHFETHWQINSNFHYMIPGTRNFIGVEINKEISSYDFDMVVRPQMRVSIAENLLIGIVGGIPFEREVQRLSTFIRLIYEPGHTH